MTEFAAGASTARTVAGTKPVKPTTNIMVNTDR
jgi:hypothetical protein